jgi:hypothetical protein
MKNLIISICGLIAALVSIFTTRYIHSNNLILKNQEYISVALGIIMLAGLFLFFRPMVINSLKLGKQVRKELKN